MIGVLLVIGALWLAVIVVACIAFVGGSVIDRRYRTRAAADGLGISYQEAADLIWAERSAEELAARDAIAADRLADAPPTRAWRAVLRRIPSAAAGMLRLR